MRFLVAAIVLAFISPAYADTDQIVGVWRLLSYERKILETGEIEKTLGQTPVGYLNYTPGGHFFAVMFGGDRPLPTGDVPTAEEALKWFKTTIAGYAGTYRVEGKTVVHHADVAWNPTWVGTNQVRHFNLEGDHLTIETPPSKSSLDGKMTVRYLKFERVE